MIDNLTEATRLLKATQLMLLGKDNQLISDLYYALQMSLDLIEESEWISVKERLPEEYGNYLVVTDNGEIDIGTYHPRYIVPQWSLCDADGFFWVEDKDIEIVKWRPLPKI